MKPEEEKQLIDQLKADLEFERQLSLLWRRYDEILEMLNNFGTMLVPSGDYRMNYIYTKHLRDINEILGKRGFEDLKKEAPWLYENLEDAPGAGVTSWELLGKEAHKFSTKLGRTKNAVDNYIGKVAKGWQEMEKEKEENQKKFNDLTSELLNATNDSSVQKIILQHTHKFENSAQEKEINIISKIVEETAKPIKRVNLKSMNIEYDDDKPAIKVGERDVALPPFKNEHFFSRAMYEHKKGEAVDWSTIWEKMTGYDKHPDKPEPQKKDWHSTYDTMQAVNNRIKECVNTGNDLFTWKEKTVTRNY